MPLTEWYLDITELPVFEQKIIDYLAKLKPHVAKHWDLQTNIMKTYKASLLEQLLRIQDRRCAYCGLGLDRNLIDREHFVHKEQDGGWPEFMFVAENLFAACAFCNRAIKGTAKILIHHDANYLNCAFYLIHPYLETPSTHLSFLANSHGEAIIAQSLTQKGHDTMLFFDLHSPTMTRLRAAFILAREREAEMSKSDYNELISISHFKPL